MEKQEKSEKLTKEELKKLFGPVADAMIKKTQEIDERNRSIIQGILGKDDGKTGKKDPNYWRTKGR